MRRVMKWVGIGLAVVVVLIVAAIAVFYFTGGAKYAETFDIEAEYLSVTADSATLADGERLVATHGCFLCHGDDLGGAPFIESGFFMHLPAPNLTPGQGGLDADFELADFERAVRHGVNRDGRGLVIMPAETYAYLSDEEVGQMYAYLRSMAPVDNERRPTRVGPMGNAILTLNAELRPATRIDHTASHTKVVDPEQTLEFGEHRATMCTICHGEDMAGGVPSFAEEGDPPAPNLTPDRATGIGDWGEEDFMLLVRTGQRPDGTVVDSVMPWFVFGKMSDQELGAVWVYLRSLPPKPEFTGELD